MLTGLRAALRAGTPLLAAGYAGPLYTERVSAGRLGADARRGAPSRGARTCPFIPWEDDEP